MTAQLSLFSPAPPDLTTATWRTGVVPYINSEMRTGYVHLVRAPDDPERISRDEAKALGIRDLAPHRTLGKTPVIELKCLIQNLLLDRRSSVRSAPDSSLASTVERSVTDAPPSVRTH